MAYTVNDEPVPGYRLVKFLGRGNFGEVWEARGPGGVHVALKVINLGRREGLKEFKALQLVKSVHHPNLMPITAFWLKDENGYLLDDTVSFELASARSTRGTTAVGVATQGQPSELIIIMGLGEMSLFDRLAECLQQGLTGIPPRELFDYMQSAALAIDFLNSPRHDLGRGPISPIQHCDIKPQNILIVGGAAQVCDFGLARELGATVTQSMVAATPAYGAPELLEGQPPSPTTDQYSLAVSYCEMRTGVLPFSHPDSFEHVMRAHLESRLDLSALQPEERLVIQKATARDPAARYDNAKSMINALKLACSELESHVLPKVPPRVEKPASEFVPGYRLAAPIHHAPHERIWVAYDPSRRRVSLLIRDLEAAPVDLKALEIIAATPPHPCLAPMAERWILDRKNRVIQRAADGSFEKTPARLVVAYELARETLATRSTDCFKRSGRGIPPDELLASMARIAEAIDFLNAPEHDGDGQWVSIMHCNVRPHNVICDGEVVRLSNFASARLLAGPAATLPPGTLSAEPPFAAPEARENQLTHSLDQYALAACYVQARSGLQFGGFNPKARLRLKSTPPADKTMAVAQTDVVPVQETPRGSVSETTIDVRGMGELDLSLLSRAEIEVVERAMSIDPAERFESCQQFVDALRHAVRDQLAPAVETGARPGTSLVRWLIPLAAVAAMAFVGIGAWAYWNYRENQTAVRVQHDLTSARAKPRDVERAAALTSVLEGIPPRARFQELRNETANLLAGVRKDLQAEIRRRWNDAKDDDPGERVERLEVLVNDGAAYAAALGGDREIEAVVRPAQERLVRDRIDQGEQALASDLQRARENFERAAQVAGKGGLRELALRAQVGRLAAQVRGDSIPGGLIDEAQQLKRQVNEAVSDHDSRKRCQAQLIVMQAVAAASNPGPSGLESAIDRLLELKPSPNAENMLTALGEGWETGEYHRLLDLGFKVEPLRDKVVSLRPYDPAELSKTAAAQWRAKDRDGLRDSIAKMKLLSLPVFEEWELLATISNETSGPDEVDKALQAFRDRLAGSQVELDVELSEALGDLVERDDARASAALDLAALAAQKAYGADVEAIKGHIDRACATRIENKLASTPQPFDAGRFFRDLHDACRQARAHGVRSRLIDAALVESLLELETEGDPRDVLDREALDDERRTPYERYVASILLDRFPDLQPGYPASSELIAVAKAAVGPSESAGGLALAHRRQHLARLLLESAEALRREKSIAAVWAPYPQGQEQAAQAFALLGAAKDLAPDSDGLWTNWVLALYHKTAPGQRGDGTLAKEIEQVIASHLGDESRWGTDAAAVHFVRYASRFSTPEGIESLNDLVDALLASPSRPTAEEILPLYGLISDALKRAETTGGGAQAYHKPLARLYYQKCKLIRDPYYGHVKFPISESDVAAEARRSIGAALRFDGNNVDYLAEHGYVSLELTKPDLDAAENDARQATRIDPANYRGHALLGRTLLHRARTAGAAAAAKLYQASADATQRALDSKTIDDRGRMIALLDLVATYSEWAGRVDISGRSVDEFCDKAIEAVEKARAIDSSRYEFEALRNRGLAYKNLAELQALANSRQRAIEFYDTAIDEFTRAIKLQDYLPELYIYRGRSHHQRALLAGDKNIEAALKDLNEAANLNASDPWSRYWLGRVYFDRNDLAAAVKPLEESDRLAQATGSPDRWLIVTHLVVARLGSTDKPKSIAADIQQKLRTAEADFPGNSMYERSLYLALFKAGDLAGDARLVVDAFRKATSERVIDQHNDVEALLFVAPAQRAKAKETTNPSVRATELRGAIGYYEVAYARASEKQKSYELLFGYALALRDFVNLEQDPEAKAKGRQEAIHVLTAARKLPNLSETQIRNIDALQKAL